MEELQWIRESERERETEIAKARDSLFTNLQVQELPVLQPAYHLIRRKCVYITDTGGNGPQQHGP